MSKFSEFIRNGTPEEKEAVYEAVMEKACKMQLLILNDRDSQELALQLTKNNEKAD